MTSDSLKPETWAGMVDDCLMEHLTWERRHLDALRSMYEAQAEAVRLVESEAARRGLIPAESGF